MDEQARAVCDRLQLLEPDVEAVAGRVRAGRDQRVAAPERLAVEPRQGDRDALARLRALHRPVVHLDAADPNLQAGGFGSQLVALGDRPRPERPGRDRPDPAQCEHAVDVQPRRTLWL
jgi:hypothetical protein